MLRTFIAIPLPVEIRDNLAALQQQLARSVPDVKWVEHENLHVTLVFLGDVRNEEIPAVCSAAQEAVAATRPFPIIVQGLSCFPHPANPRILWAGIQLGGDEVRQVYDSVSLALQMLGFRGEERGFTPHITIGRTRSGRAGRAARDALPSHAAALAGKTTVEEICIYSSEPGETGSHYQILGRAKLKTG
jgi:2'-5' RNA ligase